MLLIAVTSRALDRQITDNKCDFQRLTRIVLRAKKNSDPSQSQKTTLFLCRHVLSF